MDSVAMNYVNEGTAVPFNQAVKTILKKLRTKQVLNFNDESLLMI